MSKKLIGSILSIKKNYFVVVPLTVFSFIILYTSCRENTDLQIAYEVSMDQPGHHYFQVKLNCSGVKSDQISFNMPVWTPGYYKVQDLSKNVTNFSAKDKDGNELKWIKTSKNTWQVDCPSIKDIEVTYEVFANKLSVVESFLDEGIGFISPTGVFMHVEGAIENPVKVKFNLPENWTEVNTGLDRLEGEEHKFLASNFNILYDCPVLLGNQYVKSFEVKGIPHYIAIEGGDSSGIEIFVKDLTKIIESATEIFGDIPYKHYTFIILGSAGGGLEHSNSTALSCHESVGDTSDLDLYKGWLSFVAHEYFHLYNVKTIRPIALGPFDYDRENYTNLLWLSEGGTVYYEYLILNRAGILDRKESLDGLSECIANYENRPGHKYESAIPSSFDAWIHFFQRNADIRNNTISYYDKGAALCMLLDLKIRFETDGEKSFDDVMRLLYQKYYKEKDRGFTDAEFKESCEQVAGVKINEIFKYANTVMDIDYNKYLSYVGLKMDIEPVEVDGKVYFGALTRQEGKELKLVIVERNSPAWNAGLGINTIINLVDNKKIDQDGFKKILKKKKPGDILKLNVTQYNTQRDLEIQLEQKMETSFEITEDSVINEQQSRLLNHWLVGWRY